MSFGWEAVAARARGMSTHLLDDETLARLSAVDEAGALFEILGRSSYGEGVQRTGGDPATVEAAVDRVLARRLDLLTRWMRPHESLLAGVFLPLDARTVRGIVRGMAAGLPPGERSLDAVPTPLLDRKAVSLLAAATSPGAVGATLVTWGHPLGRALSRATSGPDAAPSLFELEAALGRAMAEGMTEAARRGDGPLRRYTREEIDAWNLAIALTLAATSPEVDPATLHLPGGEIFDAESFLDAARAETRPAAVQSLARTARGTLFELPLAGARQDPAALDDRVLDLRIERRGTETRRHPLSSAPVLDFILRIRRESRVVRRAAWRASLPSRRAS